ncbi:hypothetical protein LUZ61_003033 [Rhynchospora tenuis]|uniref:Uncharacterized protein n=1 Tax=Rhynchospora tenuis TaxID=198213 RepID=A0AAD6ES87_9POAL|nr:hypothetical protein LUZ61_003033 [Rhynchospora tenuis]
MEEKKENHAITRKEKRKGGLRTMPFIFANEVAEKLAVVGFSTNMLSYLTQQLHVPLAKAANTLTNFNGTASLTPLLGAFLADSYIGRFWTITGASLFYQIGMTILTLSASIPRFRPPQCTPNGQDCKEALPWQLAILYTSLFVNALGAGGYRPCIVAFGAEQFDENDPKEKTKTWSFFNWYYFCMGVSMLLAVTAVVYVQDNVGWGWGLGIPTVAMAVSVAAFVLGYPMYRQLEPSGSPFTRLVQVVVAAIKKRNVPMVSDPKHFYENDEMDEKISIYGNLVHTNQLSFFDRAAIITESDNPSAPNPWRLNTVHRVEELKSVIRMGPIWAAGILVITGSAQQGTFYLQQARTMDRHLSPHSTFQIPPGSMTVFTYLSMVLAISFYDRLLVPFARKFTGLERGLTFLQRMGIGFGITTLATMTAAIVEARRKHVAAQAGLLDSPGVTVPMSVFWLVPQYALHGITEAFASIGHLEFMYDQAPESMRSTSTALYWMSISAGSYVSTMIVSLVHKYSAGPNGSNWLPNNLNRGKLENFYWLIALLQGLNLMYYLVCAKYYTYKPLEIRKREDELKNSV